MTNKGKSIPDVFGGLNHYDEHGRKTGYSQPTVLGGMIHYDEHGHKIGRSDPKLFGVMNHYDANGKKVGSSYPDIFGGYTNYDSNDKKISTSYARTLGGYSHGNSSQGCYIATCVYGSYDCPEVWVLRRYRDYSLASSAFGRLFIQCYYAISPKLVSLFGTHDRFKAFWKRFLDRKIETLRSRGFSDEPYSDRNW